MSKNGGLEDDDAAFAVAVDSVDDAFSSANGSSLIRASVEFALTLYWWVQTASDTPSSKEATEVPYRR